MCVSDIYYVKGPAPCGHIWMAAQRSAPCEALDLKYTDLPNPNAYEKAMIRQHHLEEREEIRNTIVDYRAFTSLHEQFGVL